MDYRDLHPYARLQSDTPRHGVHEATERDEPVALFVAMPATAPDPDNERITLGGVTWPLWQWREGLCIQSEPDHELLARYRLEAEQDQVRGDWFVCDPHLAGCWE